MESRSLRGDPLFKKGPWPGTAPAPPSRTHLLMTCTPVISRCAASEPQPFMTVGPIPDAPGGPGALNDGRDKATHGRTLRTCFLPARPVRPSFGALSSRSPPSRRSSEAARRKQGGRKLFPPPGRGAEPRLMLPAFPLPSFLFRFFPWPTGKQTEKIFRGPGAGCFRREKTAQCGAKKR